MFVHIGYDHFVNAEQLECFMPPQSQSTKRKVSQAKKAGFFHDCTLGKGWKSVLIMNNGHIYASHLTSSTIVQRIHSGHYGKEKYEKLENPVFNVVNNGEEEPVIIPMVIDAGKEPTLEQRLIDMRNNADSAERARRDDPDAFAGDRNRFTRDDPE